MSKPLNILEGESVEEFDALSASLQSEFAPATPTEHTLVDMMIHHEWMMRRALRMQQHLEAAATDKSKVDPKRLTLVVRYYRTHERGYSQAKRQLQLFRKNRQKLEASAPTQSPDSRTEQRQWEQLLKKMPPLTNWVN